MSQFKHTIIMLLISAIPFVELRGAIPYGAAFDIPFWECVLLCMIGNMLPVPFIILFVRKIFGFCRKKGWFVKQIEWLENRVMKKSGVVKKYETVGLAIFVGIPLPGTGAWTGTLAASFLNLGIKTTSLAVSCGVVIAGLIMGLASTGLLSIIGL